MSKQDELAEAISALPAEGEFAQRTVKELVQMGVEIRDQLKVEKRKFDIFEATSKGMLARISMALKTKADELGVDSFKTEEGTAYRHLKESYRVGAWDDTLKFIQETGNWQMLEKRVAKLATKEIHESLGKIPPGIEYVAEEEFVIRRPNERKESNE